MLCIIKIGKKGSTVQINMVNIYERLTDNLDSKMNQNTSTKAIILCRLDVLSFLF